MGQPQFHEFHSHGPRGPSEPARKTHGRYLHQRPHLHKPVYPLKLSLNPMAPFHMGNNRNNIPEPQLEQKILYMRGYKMVGEFEEDIPPVVYGMSVYTPGSTRTLGSVLLWYALGLGTLWSSQCTA